MSSPPVSLPPSPTTRPCKFSLTGEPHSSASFSTSSRIAWPWSPAHRRVHLADRPAHSSRGQACTRRCAATRACGDLADSAQAVASRAYNGQAGSAPVSFDRMELATKSNKKNTILQSPSHACSSNLHHTQQAPTRQGCSRACRRGANPGAAAGASGCRPGALQQRARAQATRHGSCSSCRRGARAQHRGERGEGGEKLGDRASARGRG